MNTRTVFLSIWLLCGVVEAQSISTSRGTDPVHLSVCDVLAKPLVYDGRLVSLTGGVVATEEGEWLKGYGCPGIFSTEGYVWDSIISLEMPGTPFQIHGVDFGYDGKGAAELAPKYKRLRRRLPDRCIAWTYTGLFETRKEWSKMRSGNPRGFGHLNAAPAELILKSVDAVAAVPNCR